MSEDRFDLVNRLRTMGSSGWNPIGNEAADRIAALEAKVRELEAENFALSAGSCCEIDGLTADEGGVIYCRKVKQLAASRQQVERLVEALKRAERKLSAYVGVCTGDKELTDTVLPLAREALAAVEKELGNAKVSGGGAFPPSA